MGDDQHKFLDRIEGDIRSVREAAESLASEMSERQLTWQPARDRWSVAQCFEHLRRVDAAYTRRMSAALDSSPVKASPGLPFRPTLSGRLFHFGSSPASRFPIPAPRAFRPKPGDQLGGSESMRRFLNQQAEVIALIGRARDYDINAVRFPSPLSRLLRFTIGDGLAIVAGHEQRHLAQAMRLTQSPDFPTTGAD